MSIMQSLYQNHNPYDNLDINSRPNDTQGWGSTNPNFETMIKTYRPEIIVEIGTWKGASALHMAQLATNTYNLHNIQIICVDTWLGAIEHYDEPNSHSLRRKNGYPELYYTFLANVARAKLQNNIIPFPTTSAIAARWLKQNNIQPNLVYIDGSHATEDVFSDLTNYFGLLKENGALFGDDYVWPSVAKAVELFAKINKLEVQHPDYVQWQINKPVAFEPVDLETIIEAYAK